MIPYYTVRTFHPDYVIGVYVSRSVDLINADEDTTTAWTCVPLL
jgi:hypothetical protein